MKVVIVHENHSISLRSDVKILEDIDMQDCFDPWNEPDMDGKRYVGVFYWDTLTGTFRELICNGPHHSNVHPLFIALYDLETGDEIISGYGTDH